MHRQPRRQATFAIVGLAALLLLQACDATVPPIEGPEPEPPATITESSLVVGVTHGELSADQASTPEANAPAHGVLEQLPLQNQHLMGWGSLNPEPTPGERDWRSLDERIEQIRDSGATPVLTLCCAPDWMKGGEPGTTDWSKLELRPSEAHIADFAELSAEAAARYPDITHFQVWNELKGFYDPVTNNWDMPGYMHLYNAVYDAVKAVRPDALIGGPYSPVDIWSDAATMSHPSEVTGPWGTADQRSLDAITYWLTHAHGGDFVTLDGRIVTRDQGLVTDPFTATQFYADVTAWLRNQTDLPVWWSELHTSDRGVNFDLAKQDAVTTVALGHLASSGASVVLHWAPQAMGTTCEGCLWSDPTTGVAAPTPLAHSTLAFIRCVPPGANWTGNTSTDPKLYQASSGTGTFLVNQTAQPLDVLHGDSILTLTPHEVRVIPTADTCWR